MAKPGSGLNGRLTGGRELSYIEQKIDPYVGSLFRRIINGINLLADHSASSAVGKLVPPPPLDGINVQGNFNAATNTMTCTSEHLHWTLTHNQSIKKGIQYLTEIDTTPSFSQPHIVDHGCSRSGFLHLPSMQSDGITPQVYYMKSYPQYHGSDPQKPTFFGGQDNPTKIVMTGTSACTLLPSQGSGTASNGQQGSKGLGVVLTRPAPGPKRNLQNVN